MGVGEMAPICKMYSFLSLFGGMQLRGSILAHMIFMAQISVFMDHCWVFIVTSLKPTIVRFVRLFIKTAVELL